MLITGAFAIAGLIFGSFLNVLILRYNTGKGYGGRSQCFSCARSLTSRDLFPVLSYVFTGGRCRACKSKISKQYIAVELLTALLFAFVYLHNSQYLAVAIAEGIFPGIFLYKVILECFLMSLLVFMAGYDLRHKIIPDPAVFTFAIVALIESTIVPAIVAQSMNWMMLLAGPLLALPFYLIWLLSGGRWMGLGDAKLALGIGWMLGLSAGGTAIIFGFWVGAFVSVLIMISYRLMKVDAIRRSVRRFYMPNLTLKSEVPFAPFLMIGLLIVYVLGYNLFTLWIL